MQSSPTRHTDIIRRSRGMSLLELTVVILVLLGLVSVLSIGARAWKRGSDKSLCLLNIQIVQKAVRGYGNMYGYNPGDEVSGLRQKIFAKNAFIEFQNGMTCQGGGVYSYGGSSGENFIPEIGSLYLSCSLSSSHDHLPPAHAEW